MKVAGFTFIRNALKFDFPVVEAITSVLPLCDLFVVAVGDSEDDTLELIRRIDPQKIRIVETVWNSSLVSGGAVYADETNKAFDAIPEGFDWCFYIQGDEVLHEKYLEPVRQAMQKWADHPEVEGLLFRYRHFFGTFDYTGDSRRWYRREIRVVRNDKKIRSYRDAQGFRRNGQKLAVVAVDAEIYHYGWVRHPRDMQQKIEEVRRFYHGISETEARHIAGQREFDYSRSYDALARFTGSHPQVMHNRISRLNWPVEVDLKKVNMNLRYRLLYWFEKLTGIRPFEYRNFRLLKRW